MKVKVVDCFYSDASVLLTVQICRYKAASAADTTLTTFIIQRIAYPWIIYTDSFSCNVIWNRELLLSACAMHNGTIFHSQCCSSCSSVRKFSLSVRFIIVVKHFLVTMTRNCCAWTYCMNVSYVVGHEQSSCFLFRCMFCDYFCCGYGKCTIQKWVSKNKRS